MDLYLFLLIGLYGWFTVWLKCIEPSITIITPLGWVVSLPPLDEQAGSSLSPLQISELR